jgi:hypothetical protein
MTLCPAVEDRYILALDVAGFLQPWANRRREVSELFRRAIVQEAHNGHCWLRVGNKRPSRRVIEYREKFAPPHVHTSPGDKACTVPRLAQTADVGLGPLPDIRAAKSHVCFTPESGHLQCTRACLLRARIEPTLLVT